MNLIMFLIGIVIWIPIWGGPLSLILVVLGWWYIDLLSQNADYNNYYGVNTDFFA